MRGTVPAQPFEDVGQRVQDERQQDALGLGRVQRPLQRRLCGLLVAELLAGGRVEDVRLDRRRRPVKGRRRALEHGREDVERPFGRAIGQRDDGFGNAHVGAVALVLVRVLELRARRGVPAEAHLRSEPLRARGDGERVLAGEQRLHALGGVERAPAPPRAVPARARSRPRA